VELDLVVFDGRDRGAASVFIAQNHCSDRYGSTTVSQR